MHLATVLDMLRELGLTVIVAFRIILVAEQSSTWPKVCADSVEGFEYPGTLTSTVPSIYMMGLFAQGTDFDC